VLVLKVQKGKNLFAVSFCENYESLLNPTLFYLFGWYLDYTKDKK